MFCRFVLIITSRGGHQAATKATTTAAQAFSGLSLSSSSSRGITAHRGAGSSVRNSLFSTKIEQRAVAPTARLLASSSSSSPFESSQGGGGDEKRPTTGWNHNLPKKNSTFWSKPTNGESLAASSVDPNARTGWLHRTVPRVQEEKEAKAAKTTKRQAARAVAQQEAPDSSSSSTVSEARRTLNLAMKKQERNHRIISPPAFHACGDGRRVVVTEHKISLPVYRRYNQPEPRIDVYFSVVEEVNKDNGSFFESLASASPEERAEQYVTKMAMTNGDDMILYLQGGPGFGAPTPISSLGLSGASSWASRALGKHFKRIVLMDQRGTGRSTPVTKQRLMKQFPDLFLLDEDSNTSSTSVTCIDDITKDTTSSDDNVERVQNALTEATKFMGQLRADNIVRDAEEIKDTLLLATNDDASKPRPYGAALGQSFGGFCMMTYLSQIAHPPRVCLLTGGIAPMLTPIDQVYTSLWDRVKERCLQYYDMYPGDVAVVKRIVKTLLQKPVALPSGGTLTARRFLSIGMGLGGSPSAFASMHELINNAFLNDENDDEFTKTFLKKMEFQQPFDDYPIYFLLHESIYADGPERSPTQWSAHRMYKQKSPDEFDYKVTVEKNDDTPTLFFGEMVFPWFAEDDFVEVSGLGMRLLAHALANRNDWEPLYDGEHMRKVLNSNNGVSRAAAAVYYDDLYVDFDACMEVTKRGGPLERCKVWISNEYQHSGLRDSGAEIFTKLHGMATGTEGVPS